MHQNERFNKKQLVIFADKIADKITSVSKKYSAELRSNDWQNNETEDKASPKDVPKKRYISPEERQQITDELRLV